MVVAKRKRRTPARKITTLKQVVCRPSRNGMKCKSRTRSSSVSTVSPLSKQLNIINSFRSMSKKKRKSRKKRSTKRKRSGTKRKRKSTKRKRSGSRKRRSTKRKRSGSKKRRTKRKRSGSKKRKTTQYNRFVKSNYKKFARSGVPPQEILKKIASRWRSAKRRM